MNVEKAGKEVIEALVKMRLSYLIEDNGSLDAQDLAAIKRELPGCGIAGLDEWTGLEFSENRCYNNLVIG